MKLRQSIVCGLVALVLYSVPVSAHAASDGSLGSSSTGEMSISIFIAPRILISSIQDLTPPDFTGSGDRVDNDDICVYTNSQSGAYRITATGDGSGGAFAVRDPQTGNLPYSLYWNDTSGTTGGVALQPGVALVNQTGADTSSQTCSGSGNSNIRVVFQAATLLANQPGTYSGNVALLVEPE